MSHVFEQFRSFDRNTQ